MPHFNPSGASGYCVSAKTDGHIKTKLQ